MSAIVYALQMPECSSCGRFLGHLYDDHVELTKKLTLNIENNTIDDEYIGTVSGVNISNFIITYYKWVQKPENANVTEFTPLNIVSRAFLSLKDLTEDDLPFGTTREPDGQRSVFDHPLCCLRMFQGNPVIRL